MRLLGLLLLASPLLAQPIDLQGPWRFHPTDSPEWASPDTDTSGWGSVMLPQRDPRPESVYWLRRSFPTPARTEDLAVAIGLVSARYEVYWNGVKIGDTGDIGSARSRFPRPRQFAVPSALVRAGSQAVLALRVYRPQIPLGAFTYAIADRGPYLVTERWHAEAAVESARRGVWLSLGPALLIVVIQFGVALLFLVLWLSGRERMEWLYYAEYLFTLSTMTLVGTALLIWDVHSFQQLVYRPMGALAMLLQIQFTVAVLRRPRLPGWLLLSLAVVGFGLAVTPEAPVVYVHPGLIFLTLYCLYSLPKTAPVRRWFVLPILLFLAVLFNNTMPPAWRLFPPAIWFGLLGVSVSHLVQLVFATAMMVMMLRQVRADRREQQRLAAELEAARAVQQFLLPQARVETAAFRSEATYLPAAEVGGDFYWTRSESGGALIVVVGDVSGKGLKAAMLVSVAVGILRNEKSGSPGVILSALNAGLVGHTGGGFVTCCCARFDAPGTVTFANAGHPAPYGDGREVEMEAGLPLGVVEGVGYEETTATGMAFTFVSDGVVEAASESGELFGFERTQEISGKSAGEIAAAAQAWGQNDDITVVTVRRIASHDGRSEA